MSDDLKTMIARRPLLAGALAALGLAAVGGAVYQTGIFGPSYPKSSYDDLLRLLPDRAAAVALGRAVLAENPAFDAKITATHLRGKIGHRSLDAVLTSDIESDDLYEAKGWVLPATLAQLCTLAAETNPISPLP